MLPSSSLVLVFLDSPHVLGFQNVVGKDVELHIAQSLQFDDPDVQTRILVSEAVALVSYEDHVHFLFDYLLEEHVVTTIGTRLYMVEVVDHQEQVRVRVFVEGLEVEHSRWILGHLCNVVLEIWLALLFDFFAVDYVDSTWKESSLDADPAEFLDESALADSIATTDLDVLRFFFAVELPANLSDFLPFPVDAERIGVLPLEVDVVSLPETRRKVHELSFAHSDYLLRRFSHLNLEIFKKVNRVLYQLTVDVLYPP